MVSGITIRVEKMTLSLDEALGGKETLWKVQTLAAQRQNSTVVELDSMSLITFLQESEAENVCVSVSDSRQLVGMMLRPRVPIDLSRSTIEYFELESFLDCVLRSFLRDVNFPRIESE